MHSFMETWQWSLILSTNKGQYLFSMSAELENCMKLYGKYKNKYTTNNYKFLYK